MRSSSFDDVERKEDDEYAEQAAAISSMHYVAAASLPNLPALTEEGPKEDDGGDAARTRPLSRWQRCRQFTDPRTWRPLSGWPLLLTYFLLTFAQALPGTAVGLMLANELHMGSDEVYQFRAATFVPWTIRPVYAFVSDQVPLFGYRRRPYFVLCAVLACGAQVALALWGNNKASFLVLAVATQMFLAFCEVVCDSLSVEWGNELALRVCAAQIRAVEAVVAPQEEATRTAALPPHDTQRQGEWATPLLPAGQADSSNDKFLHQSRSVASTPQVLSRSPSAMFPADGRVGGYSTLEDTAHLSTAAASPPASSTATPAPSPNVAPPVEPHARTDAFATKVIDRLLKDTPDPTTLTPVVLKSRIQTECASVRSAGSVCASALSTYVMLVYLSPRAMLMWSSLAFLLGLVSMAFHGLERKVGCVRLFGSFGIATTGVAAPEVESIQESVAAASPPAPRARSPLEGEDAEAVELSASASYVAIRTEGDAEGEGAAVASTRSRPTAAAPSTQAHMAGSLNGYAALDEEESPAAAAGASSASSSTAAAAAAPVLGLDRSRWWFLWLKLLALFRALRQLAGPLAFVFLVDLMPTSGDAYYNFMYTVYSSEFTPSQFSEFNMLSLAGAFVGCIAYQRWLAPTRKGIRIVFVWTTILASLAGCTQIVLARRANDRVLHISDGTWIRLSSFFVSSVGTLSSLPPIILASYYAPKDLGLEASMFSLFAATAHVASLAEAQLTAGLVRTMGMAGTNYSNLWKLILICNCLALLPLALMPILLHPKVTGRSDDEDAHVHTAAAPASNSTASAAAEEPAAAAAAAEPSVDVLVSAA